MEKEKKFKQVMLHVYWYERIKEEAKRQTIENKKHTGISHVIIQSFEKTVK